MGKWAVKIPIYFVEGPNVESCRLQKKNSFRSLEQNST